MIGANLIAVFLKSGMGWQVRIAALCIYLFSKAMRVRYTDLAYSSLFGCPNSFGMGVRIRSELLSEFNENMHKSC